MDLITQLQPLDLLLVLLWAAVVGWGLKTGLIRQLTLAVAAYVAAVAAAQLSPLLGRLLGALQGAPSAGGLNQVLGYGLVFVFVLLTVGFLSYRFYPNTHLARHRRVDAVLGALVGAAWGALLLAVLVGVVAAYTQVFAPGQELTQQSLAGQVARSRVALALRGPLAPLWQLVSPFLPANV